MNEVRADMRLGPPLREACRLNWKPGIAELQEHGAQVSGRPGLRALRAQSPVRPAADVGSREQPRSRGVGEPDDATRALRRDPAADQADVGGGPRRRASSSSGSGFDSVWVCDHLYGVPMPNLPILEAWSELAAVAADHRARRARHAGDAAVLPQSRPCSPSRSRPSTRSSNGRVIVGLGSGWFATEFEAYGAPFPPVGERLRALEETVRDHEAAVDRGAGHLRGHARARRSRRGASPSRCAVRPS